MRYAAVIALLSLAVTSSGAEQPRTGVGSDGVFRITPQRPVPELRAEALAAQPPAESGQFRSVDLVEVTKLDPTVKLDIRYATSNNFLSTPVYTRPAAYLQRPAAEALVRVHRALSGQGYGLLIHDAYRPWWVTKVFWEATSPSLREFVADPAQGSRHNRGCAVDLTLYDLRTGKAVSMPSVYDEMTPRAYPGYTGGTPAEREHRELLRQAMEREGFTVYETEWWHFDFKEWRQYPIVNVDFDGTPRDDRIRQVESELLPKVALRENVGHRTTLEQRMRELGIPGVSIAVIDEGKIAWTRAYGVRDTVDGTPVTVDTLFQAGSISKPIAALGALRLVKEGKLSLDDDVNAKLKTWRVPDNDFTKDEKVTLRRVMSHTAGLTVHGFPGYAVGSGIPTVVQVLDGQPPANTSPVRVDVRPGSAYRYSGGGYTVMQLLIADASNDSFESFMQSNVLDVLGMTSSSYSQNPPPALAARRASAHHPGGKRIPGKLHIYPEMAAAGLWTTPGDLARYLLYVPAAVRGETGQLLTPSLAKELVTRQSGGQHGLGPQILEVGEFARFGHGGVDQGFEANMVGYVARGQGVVIMANANFAGMLFAEIEASVARVYEWPGFPIEPQLEAERISRTLQDRAPGKYQLNPQTAAFLRARGGRLFFELPEGGAFEVFAKSSTELFAPPFGPITFQLVEVDGQVTALKTSKGREFKRIDP